MVCWNMCLNKTDWRENPWNVNINLSQFELQTIPMGASRIRGGMDKIGGPTLTAPPPRQKISLGPPCEIFQDPRVISLYKRLGHICINQYHHTATM